MLPSHAAEATETAAKPIRRSVPLTCTHDSGSPRFVGKITMPGQIQSGTTITIRVDGVSSGKISHTGLNYIHQMKTDFSLSSGLGFVPGSARIIAGTGTKNVRKGARVGFEDNLIRLVLPGRVKNGRSYTAPSIAFDVAVSGEHEEASLQLVHYELKANAFIVGDVLSECEPSPSPFELATARVAGARAE